MQRLPKYPLINILTFGTTDDLARALGVSKTINQAFLKTEVKTETKIEAKSPGIVHSIFSSDLHSLLRNRGPSQRDYTNVISTRLLGHYKLVSELRCSNNGRWLFIKKYDDKGGNYLIHVLDLTTNVCVGELVHTEPVFLAISPNDKYLVTGGFIEGVIQVWDYQLSQCIGIIDHSITKTKQPLWAVTMLSNNNIIAAYGSLFSPQPSQPNILMFNYSEGGDYHLSFKFGEIGETYVSFALMPDEKLLITGNVKGKIQIWEVETGHLLNTLHLKHDNQVSSIVLLQKGRYLISGSEEAIMVWERGHPSSFHYNYIKTLRGHPGKVHQVVATHNDHHVFSSSMFAEKKSHYEIFAPPDQFPEEIRVWDILTGDSSVVCLNSKILALTYNGMATTHDKQIKLFSFPDRCLKTPPKQDNKEKIIFELNLFSKEKVGGEGWKYDTKKNTAWIARLEKKKAIELHEILRAEFPSFAGKIKLASPKSVGKDRASLLVVIEDPCAVIAQFSKFYHSTMATTSSRTTVSLSTAKS
jgi:WD40 repeat protein